jgi:predicted peptidase
MVRKLKKGQQAKVFRKTIRKKVALEYLLFLPENYDDDGEKWPFILFLHGAGERGADLGILKKNGIPKVIEEKAVEGKVDFPFIVASPQCPTGAHWQPDALSALLDDLVGRYAIDEERIYLTGLSMGGMGTWALAGEEPKRFAAIAPVCGGGTRYGARRIGESQLPTWVFHGAKDKVVPLEESQRMVDQIKKYKGKVKFNIYPNAGHDSWTHTYDNPRLYTWFLSHCRRDV